MVLGTETVQRLITEKGLITEATIEQVRDMEGVAFNLRLEGLYQPNGAAQLMISKRITPIAPPVPFEDGEYMIVPGQYYLAQTIEEVNMPPFLRGELVPRTTMFRSGIAVYVGSVDPGYKGKLTVGLQVVQGYPVAIEKGFRFLSIIFHSVYGGSTLYDGVWQGGKVGTDGKEERPY